MGRVPADLRRRPGGGREGTVISGLEPAGLFLRSAAWVVDRLILGSLWVLLGSWGFVAYVNLARWPGDLKSLTALAGLLLLWGIALHAVYFVIFVGGCGQTPGKMLCGITVVRQDSSVVGYGRALLRWIGYGLAALPLGLGFLGVLFTAERRGLHDWIAGTRVVRRAGRRVSSAYAFGER